MIWSGLSYCLHNEHKSVRTSGVLTCGLALRLRHLSDIPACYNEGGGLGIGGTSFTSPWRMAHYRPGHARSVVLVIFRVGEYTDVTTLPATASPAGMSTRG